MTIAALMAIHRAMKGSRTKERLLRVGLDQVSVFGLSAVTLGQLADASGLSKSGLFAHFQSKEELQLELLDQFVSVIGRRVAEPAMRAAPGLPRLHRLLELWLGWPARAGLSGGCPLSAALFELDDLDGRVRDHVRELEAQWRAMLVEVVSDAVAEGDLSTDTDVDQFVWEICGIYLAHHVASRFVRNRRARVRARTALAGLIERHQAVVARRLRN
ncbi:TetR/AcrR family transcriptional regulator [Mesorhizobium sp. CO1-1-8]|uniref:TetR/AcrR family transcriptional regulator n=1 Tax=Mesorhizobium sp. CO1-1-8 TaxID=2876631 RepID=UPI001CD0A4B3|nr:TetR/AcrR family transcriptional regulator [Mesorhizobium sp. CO1-1-8]MBZ9772395.1 TetR/AcrR family transcriptional regulator [Mesorhizobium sp. CO1-1-8]